MAGALDGIKILSFAHFGQVPAALQILGDLGADIINIEQPGGEFNRRQLVLEQLHGESLAFLGCNRNRRAITLNLKNKKTAPIVEELIRRSDVVATNFRPGTLDKLGYGYEDCKKINPGIIFAEAVGFGVTGPYAKLPGQDLISQCMTGYVNIVGPEGPPNTGGTFLMDSYTCVMLTSAIQAALIYKMRTGKGQRVSVNALSCGIHLQSSEFMWYLNVGEELKRPKGYSATVQSEAPYGLYKTKDGYMGLSNLPPEKVPLFEELIGAEGLQPLMYDKDSMLKNRDEVYPIVAKALEKKTTQEWLDTLRKYDIWCAKVNSYEEVVNDPQVIHNEIIQTMSHPRAGDVKVIATPMSLSETPVIIRRPPPMLGEHNAEVLAELGYSEADIEAFASEGLF